MRKIENYLTKLADNQVNSQTTISKYFSIGHLSIRYSDHIHLPPSNVDLQIVIPSGSYCDYYLVIYKDNSKPMILNAKQIISMLDTLVAISSLDYIAKPSIEKENNPINEMPKKLITVSIPKKSKYASIKEGVISWDSNTIRLLQGLLNFIYNSTKGFGGLHRYLLDNPCTTAQAITLFRHLYDNKIVFNYTNCDKVMSYIKTNL